MKAVLKHQNLLKSGVIFILGCAASGVILWILGEDPVSRPSDVSSKIETAIPASPQEVFHHKIESETDRLSKTLEVQSKLLDEVMKKLEALSEPRSDLRQDEQLKQQISALEQKLNARADSSMPAFSPSILDATPDQKRIRRVVLNLSNAKKMRTGKTVDNTIPSGAFARATILEGVDASTSVTASSDPRPTLLRILDPGTLPRGFHSDVKDCHVTAASFGDSSSERVFMRLEKLSCVERATGEILQMNVQGHVSGEDGRAGIKGLLVDRTGPLMRNSFIAGFFGNMGAAIGQHAAQTPLLSTPLGIQQNPMNTTQLLQQGAGKGVQGALEQYAQFYIKRAEQMQPVIVVEAGRVVNIVFSEEAQMSPTLVRQAITQASEGHRIQRAGEMAKSLDHGMDQSLNHGMTQDIVTQTPLKG